MAVGLQKKSILSVDIGWSLTCDAGRRRTAKDDLSVWDFSIWRHCFLLYPTFMSLFSYFCQNFWRCPLLFWEQFFEKFLIEITYWSYVLMYIFWFTNLMVGSVLLIYTPQGKKLCMYYLLIGQKYFELYPWFFSTNAIFVQTAVRNCYKIVVHNSQIPVRNCYKIVEHYFFYVILVHSVFIFFDTQFSRTKRGKTTRQGRWYVSINKGGCGICSRNNHEEIEKQCIPPSKDRRFG